MSQAGCAWAPIDTRHAAQAATNRLLTRICSILGEERRAVAPPRRLPGNDIDECQEGDHGAHRDLAPENALLLADILGEQPLEVVAGTGHVGRRALPDLIVLSHFRSAFLIWAIIAPSEMAHNSGP